MDCLKISFLHLARKSSFLYTQTLIAYVHNLAVKTDPVREPASDGSFMFHTIKRRFRVSSPMHLSKTKLLPGSGHNTFMNSKLMRVQIATSGQPSNLGVCKQIYNVFITLAHLRKKIQEHKIRTSQERCPIYSPMYWPSSQLRVMLQRRRELFSDQTFISILQLSDRSAIILHWDFAFSTHLWIASLSKTNH